MHKKLLAEMRFCPSAHAQSKGPNADVFLPGPRVAAAIANINDPRLFGSMLGDASDEPRRRVKTRDQHPLVK